MRISKKIFLTLVASVLIMGVAACNSFTSTNDTNKQAVAKEEIEARKDIKAKLKTLISKMNEDQEEEGYLSAADFVAFKNEFNLIANATKSSAQIETNDTDSIEDNISSLQDHINFLKGSSAIEAIDRYKSKEVVYKSTLMESLHILLNSTDVHNADNELNTFNSLHSDLSSISMEEFNEDAASSINQIKFTSYKRIEDLKTEIKKRQSSFSKEEVESLNSAIQNLHSSLQDQVAVLYHFQTMLVDDGTSVDDKLNAAITNFDDASEKVAELEENLGVTYEEE